MNAVEELDQFFSDFNILEAESLFEQWESIKKDIKLLPQAIL